MDPRFPRRGGGKDAFSGSRPAFGSSRVGNGRLRSICTAELSTWILVRILPALPRVSTHGPPGRKTICFVYDLSMKIRARRAARQHTAVAYVRYSTDLQGVKSLARQTEAIDAWAARTATTITAVYFDRAVSRTTDFEERPGLVAALDALRAGDAVVAESATRYAGDPFILEGIRREARRHGARVATSRDIGDDAHDEDLQDMETFFSKREIKAIRQRTKATMAVMKMRGERVGSIPYGKRLAADGRHLEDEPAEQVVIRRALDLDHASYGIKEIAATLGAEGVTNRHGQPPSWRGVYKWLARHPESNFGSRRKRRTAA